MNQGPRRISLMKKNGGKKSRETIALSSFFLKSFWLVKRNAQLEIRVVTVHQGVLETIKFLFRFEPKQTETQSVSVVFRFVSRNQKSFFSVCFGLFRCFGPVSKQPKQTEFSRNKPKQTEKSPKNLGVLETVNFFSRFEPKQTETQSVLVCFFGKPKKIFFGLFQFVLMFRTSFETTETNRTYGMGN